MRGWRWLVLLLVLALLAGCSRSSSSGTLVKWRRTGGIAGWDQGLAIAPTGEVQAHTNGRLGPLGHLSPSESAELERLLQAIAPTSLRPSYDDPQVADAIFDSVAVQSTEVRWESQVGTGGKPPPELAALLAFLANLFDAHRPK
ncbi:MAG TPA: hypothetical protein VK191_15685 [Symbiobacteriaceae bacterium]|nr:hypothetical protein [Symbiobacteriaceae bacterium]